jgi:hypothetical protein
MEVGLVDVLFVPFWRYAVGPASESVPAMPFLTRREAERFFVKTIGALPRRVCRLYKRNLWNGAVTVLEEYSPEPAEDPCKHGRKTWAAAKEAMQTLKRATESFRSRGYWECDSCGFWEEREREVRCWKCASGTMRYVEPTRQRAYSIPDGCPAPVLPHGKVWVAARVGFYPVADVPGDGVSVPDAPPLPAVTVIATSPEALVDHLVEKIRQDCRVRWAMGRTRQ